MVRFLHLRAVVGAAIALSVVAVAAVTLAVSLTFALDTIRSNADSSVARLGHATARTADSVFKTPEQHLDLLHNTPRHTRRFGMLPTDHPDFTIANGSPVLDSYARLILTIETETQFSYLALYAFFYDGGMTWCQSNTKSGACETKWPNSSTTQGPSIITAHNKADGTENETLSAEYQSTGFISQFHDLRKPTHSAAFARFNATGQRHPGGSVAWIARKSFAILDGISHFAMTGTSEIRNATHLIGHSFGVIEIRTINAVLTEGLLTTNSRAVLFDRDGYLFAASTGVDVLDVNPAYNITGKPKCFTADAWSDVPATACQLALTTVRDHTVRSVALKDPGIFDSPKAAGAVRHVAKTFVFVEALPTLPGTLSLSLALFVPEEDIIGDADKILPVCAGAAAGVVVVASVVIIIILTAVLRPLESVAVQMIKAARFEKDSEQVNVSAFAEIGDLQRAFIEMRNELSRIRAFVPQSLLRAEDSTSDEVFLLSGGCADSCASSETETRSDRHCSETFNGSNDDRSPRPNTPTELPSLSPRTSACPTPGDDQRKVSNANSTVSSIPLDPHLVTEPPRVTQNFLSRGLVGAGDIVRFEKVSVLFLNLRGFNTATATKLNLEAIAVTVDTVLDVARVEKGVVDSFHGDRFMVSFNAVKPAANHDIRASIVATKLTKKAGAHFGLGVTCGIATGRAQVGNTGSDTMKRFSIVGPVVSQAACLERLCKLYPDVSCLVPQRMFEDLQTAVTLQTVDYVRLPFSKSPCLIGSVESEIQRSAHDDEWMYQLQESENKTAGVDAVGNGKCITSQCGVDVNAAWRLIARGRAAEVPVHVGGESTADGLPMPLAWERVNAAVKRFADGDSAARRLGDFYDGCIC